MAREVESMGKWGKPLRTSPASWGILVPRSIDAASGTVRDHLWYKSDAASSVLLKRSLLGDTSTDLEEKLASVDAIETSIN